MNCRFCGTSLSHVFIDLVNAPPSNSYLTHEQLDEPETYYPLTLYVCDNCFLVQIDEYKKSDAIFNSGYLYFSSYARSWLEHAKRYTGMMINRFGFNHSSTVIEIASNDGYLLQYFKEQGVPVLGIEPSAGTALEAEKKGITTIKDFFGQRLARSLVDSGVQADLLIGNNVLAHVPDINDFVAGLKIALKPAGIITMEFPHVMQLVNNVQFDTIYHEHFSYLSFTTVCSIFQRHGLDIFDVEELPTHGGSLRIYAKHRSADSSVLSANVTKLLNTELSGGICTVSYYRNFQKKADQIKYVLVSFLIEQKRNGKMVAAYGAAAKGNTLLNYCGIKKDLIAFVVDASPHKQGKFLPGSHIPIVNEEEIRKIQPAYILILPWNIRQEIIQQLDYITQWGGRFVIALPELEII